MTLFRSAVLVCLLLLAGGCRESVEESGDAAASLVEALRNLDSNFVAYAEKLEAAESVAFEPDYSQAEHKAALATLEAALKDPMFRRLNKTEQAKAYSGTGWAAMRVEQSARAAQMLEKMLTLAPDSEEDRLMLVDIQMDLKQYEKAARSLTAYVGKWSLDTDKSDLVQELVDRTEHRSPARLALLEALFKAKWKPDARIASKLWYELALRQTELNQIPAAQKTVVRITSPASLVRLRSDKRFDAVIVRTAGQFDVEAAARADVSRRLKGPGNPPSLGKATLELGYALLQLGDDQAAMVLAERVLAEPVDEDISRQDLNILTRIADQRAAALFRLGRREESLEQRKAAAKMGSKHGVNVSATLNLAGDYCSREMGKETRETAQAVVEGMNAYGRMVKHYDLHCAAVLEGDADAARRSLDYLASHQADGESPYLWALLQAGQQDQAAAAAIARLADPGKRGDMLYEMQHFRQSPGKDGKPETNSPWDRMVARQDVQAAVAAVGRIESYPIYEN